MLIILDFLIEAVFYSTLNKQKLINISGILRFVFILYSFTWTENQFHDNLNLHMRSYLLSPFPAAILFPSK